MDDLLFLFLGWPLLRRFFGRNGDPFGDQTNPSAEDILRRRYAQGEITREQFEEMQHTLAQTTESPNHAQSGV
jgi:uncharacterized membrane protein